MGLTYLFIAHDLSVVKHISNRIGVMYLGKMVELADSFELIAHSVHPYTRSLISAIPGGGPRHGPPEPPYRAAGRCAQPAESAERLPFPHPLPLRRRALRRRGAGVQGSEQRATGQRATIWTK